MTLGLTLPRGRHPSSDQPRPQWPSMGFAEGRSPLARPLERWGGATTTAGHAVGRSPSRAPGSANLTPGPLPSTGRGSDGLAGVLPAPRRSGAGG
jgi:hypothetical protein